MVEKGEGVWQRGFLPFGRASIASGYTPATVPGRCPQSPVSTRSYEEGIFIQREKKTEIITLRVTPRTKDRIRARATKAGLTVTDYLCLCGLGKEIVRVDGLDQVLSELKAQGRNLNQLTTLANMGKITVAYGDRLAESYGQISEQLRQLLREVT